jgi:hypothetical protein
MKLVKLFITAICIYSLQVNNATGQVWKPVPGNIMTPWAADVTPDNAWQEYPRPQMVRKDWKNLNGLWDFEISMGTNNRPLQNYTRKILVPFCVESALSGIKETIRGSQEMLYRRLFDIPENWKGKRILLHFEAVDYQTKLWIDDKYVGEHKGGYDAFTFDITDALNSTGTHNIKLVVWDPTNYGTQPVGKQSLPELVRGYRYTPTSGIWQTVWMEPVEEVSISSIKVLPDIDNSTFTVETGLKGWGYDHQLKVQAFDKGTMVASGEALPGKPVVMKISNPKLWSPDSPFLYDLKVTLVKNNSVVDEVESYFGMRKISMARDESGLMRINLNNKAIFQLGPLDQGYWPDGILLPASDDALKYDIEYLKKIGCNMARVHIKVHPERWYFHCDKLGLLVWQDMVSPWSRYSRSEVGGAAAWEAEWEKIMDQLYNHPSIVQWIVFNESWVQYDTERLTSWTQRKDPSRLVTNASGWIDRNVGNIRDFHDYTLYPSVAWVPKYYDRAMVIGEGGGFDLPIKGHLWFPEQTMPDKIDRAGDLVRETYNSASVLEERYTEWIDNVTLLKKYGLDAMVYTQISDVEIELNGWLTYDRKVSKILEERLAKIHSKLFSTPMKGKIILPLSLNTPQEWQYSYSQPVEDWFKKGNSGKWNTGKAPFGRSMVTVPEVNTKWENETLFLQKDVNIKTLPSRAGVIVYSSGLTNIYINGEFAMQINNLRRQDLELKVSEVILSAKAVSLLKKGTNHIAIKAEFTSAEQQFNYFDIGLVEY